MALQDRYAYQGSISISLLILALGITMNRPRHPCALKKDVFSLQYTTIFNSRLCVAVGALYTPDDCGTAVFNGLASLRLPVSAHSTRSMPPARRVGLVTKVYYRSNLNLFRSWVLCSHVNCPAVENASAQQMGPRVPRFRKC